ncbi:hypothetical protein MGG_16271 [Pyricularia oryzae 70-15]|uniref:Uncharacterized protein n=3 Tax=Pyricularia oryzae TaxID=318829 RepID=G4MQM2_PYRO7|nr:uncharacterized protein MGG_16271 [Pyricularia oryzae 70-15]EHA57309.1 hypothetical protein MGG_16271 [Pyricularia oryzae 70-15]KAI7923173.1 hypothetical protein M9X92_004449 [Pyricularia oryzae]KAI7924107.1 hypothetical protein M0657_004778 [Pyricularia oryzae]
MNMADIREMEVGQWLYWTIALPVTALVILLGLWWMGELDNVLKLSGRGQSVMTVKEDMATPKFAPFPVRYPVLPGVENVTGRLLPPIAQEWALHVAAAAAAIRSSISTSSVVRTSWKTKNMGLSCNRRLRRVLRCPLDSMNLTELLYLGFHCISKRC